MENQKHPPRYTIAEFAAMPWYRRELHRRFSDYPSDDELPAAPVRVGRKNRDPIYQNVYFIQAGRKGPIKIGIAQDCKKRLSILQVGNHEKLRLLWSSPGGRHIETRYHTTFREHWLHGEWFAPHPDILAEIARLSAIHKDK